MHQKLTLVGRLVADPDSKYLPSGQNVTNLRLAINEQWKNRDGEQQERTLWIRVATWGRLAEVCNEYLSKGRLVMVEGSLRPDDETGGPRVFQRNDGTYGSSYEVTAQLVKFLDGKDDSSDAPDAEQDSDDPIPF